MRKKSFSIQIDEATDCSGIAHLIAYIRYIEDTAINEDIFPANGRTVLEYAQLRLR
jgi:hypothetical protein